MQRIEGRVRSPELGSPFSVEKICSLFLHSLCIIRVKTKSERERGQKFVFVPGTEALTREMESAEKGGPFRSMRT